MEVSNESLEMSPRFEPNIPIETDLCRFSVYMHSTSLCYGMENGISYRSY